MPDANPEKSKTVTLPTPEEVSRMWEGLKEKGWDGELDIHAIDPFMNEYTPFLLATRKQRADWMDILIRMGADINQPSIHGYRAFYFCVSATLHASHVGGITPLEMECLNLFLEAGVETSWPEKEGGDGFDLMGYVLKFLAETRGRDIQSRGWTMIKHLLAWNPDLANVGHALSHLNESERDHLALLVRDDLDRRIPKPTQGLAGSPDNAVPLASRPLRL